MTNKQAVIEIVLKAIDKASSVLKGVGSGLSSSLGTIGSIVGNSVGAAIGALENMAGYVAKFVASSMDVASEFQSKMSMVNSILKRSQDEMNKLGEEAMRLGRITRFSADDAAEAMVTLASAGLDYETILHGATEAVLMLAAATKGDLKGAAQVFASVVNMFHLSGQEALDSVNALTAAANNANLSLPNLASALRAVGAQAYGMKMPLNDVTVLLGMFGRAGIAGTEAGTQLSRLLMYLSPVSKKAADEMARLGLITADGKNQFFDLNGQLKSGREIIETLSKAVHGMTDEQKQNTLHILFGAKAMRSANLLINEGVEGYDRLVKAMAGTSAVDMAAERMNNYKGAMDQLQDTIKTTKIALATGLFLPVAKDAANWANEILSSLAPLTNWVYENGPAMWARFKVKLSDWFDASGLAEVFAPIKQFIDSLASVKSGPKKDPKSGTLMPEDLGQGPALSRLEDAFKETWVRIKAWAKKELQDMLSGIDMKGSLTSVIDSVFGEGTATKVGNIIAKVSAFLNVVSAVATIIGGMVPQWLIDLGGMTWDAGIENLTSLGATISSVFGPDMGASIKASVDGMAADVSAGWEAIKLDTAAKWAAVTTDVQTNWETMKSDVAAKAEEIKTNVSTKWTEIKTNVGQTLSEMHQDLQGKWDGFLREVGQKMDSILSRASAKWGELKDATSKKLGEVGDDIKSKWASFVSTVETKSGEMRDKALDRWGELKTRASGVWSDMKTSAESGWDQIVSTVSRWALALYNYVSGKAKQIHDDASAWWDKVKTTAEQKWNDIKGAISKKWDELVNWVKGKLTAWEDIGRGIVEGIKRGWDKFMLSMREGFWTAIADLLAWLKGKLGMASPAKATMPFGSSMAEGIQVAFVNGMRLARDSMVGAVVSVADAIGAAIGDQGPIKLFSGGSRTIRVISEGAGSGRSLETIKTELGQGLAFMPQAIRMLNGIVGRLGVSMDKVARAIPRIGDAWSSDVGEEDRSSLERPIGPKMNFTRKGRGGMIYTSQYHYWEKWSQYHNLPIPEGVQDKGRAFSPEALEAIRAYTKKMVEAWREALDAAAKKKAQETVPGVGGGSDVPPRGAPGGVGGGSGSPPHFAPRPIQILQTVIVKMGQTEIARQVSESEPVAAWKADIWPVGVL